MTNCPFYTSLMGAAATAAAPAELLRANVPVLRVSWPSDSRRQVTAWAQVCQCQCQCQCQIDREMQMGQPDILLCSNLIPVNSEKASLSGIGGLLRVVSSGTIAGRTPKQARLRAAS